MRREVVRVTTAALSVPFAFAADARKANLPAIDFAYHTFTGSLMNARPVQPVNGREIEVSF